MNYERCTVTTGKRVRQPDEAVTQLQHEPQRVRVRAIFAFTLLETDGIVSDDFLMHTHTHTQIHTGFFLFIKQVQGKTQSLPLFAWISDRSVAVSVCEWRNLYTSQCAHFGVRAPNST